MALRISAETEQAIQDLYQSGLTFEEVSRQVGHHIATVTRSFHRCGGKVRPPNITRTGVKNGRWKGGGRVVNGYRRVWVPDDHKFAAAKSKSNCVAEHRLVMMEHLGRLLEPYEQVHHINGDKLDNRLENLQLVVGPHGNGKALCCAVCGSENIVSKELS